MTESTVDARVSAPWPSPYELATGLVPGVEPADRTGPPAPVVGSPLAALEAAVLPAVRRAPCLVSFSGGLDSSVVLAVAARVAARHGLPAPVPVTWRFTGAPAADESSWQDRVIDALGLRDRWQILRADDDLDLVGPVAQRFLHCYGVCHPLNTHLHPPTSRAGRTASSTRWACGTAGRSCARTTTSIWSARWRNGSCTATACAIP